MELQDIFPALQIRQFHRDPPVKSAGSCQGRIQCFGPVGCSQQDHALGPVKAVHFRQQLVQGLFPFVVAGNAAGIPLFAHGIDLVNEDNAWGFLPGLFEEVTDFCRTAAHEHLHKLRTGDGKEGNTGFTGHRPGQQRLAGSRRTHKQGALGHFGTDFLVLFRVFQEVHDLDQVVLGLFLPRNIGEFRIGLLAFVNLGIGLAQAVHAAEHTAKATESAAFVLVITGREGHGIRSLRHLFLHPPEEPVSQSPQQKPWQEE